MYPENKNILLITLSSLEGLKINQVKFTQYLMEFHISRRARQKYQFDDALFSSSGNIVFADFHATRVFAQKMNEKRDVINFPERAVRAGQINAIGLIDEILHYVIQLYREQINEEVMKGAIIRLEKKLGQKTLNTTLEKFIRDFPPRAVYKDGVEEKEYLKGETNGIPHRQIVLEEMLLLWLANINPAFSPYLELFDDEELEKFTNYLDIIDLVKNHFDEQPHFGPDNQNLIDMLRSPAVAQPYSLQGQLDYMRRKWGFLLGKYFYLLLKSLDLIKEEDKVRFLGPGQAMVYEFGEAEIEAERFSLDKDWMPRVVLIAKSTYVWLDQLSKKYGYSIKHLDQIPDQELDQLAQWGFTGLWLIGLWARSQASQNIKKLCGNPEAVSSAYSLFGYEIASDLGGEAAFNNLKHRAWQRGIRMAGDMVPNHMGIDSNWVIEHPDWFISLNYSPYPNYTFNGPNLSWDNRVGIFIEDHYYDRTDAAVVFKRVDFLTGDTKYIYHGNDGTSMPWNDTAQLNYLDPKVREAVIQTILHVARNFPIIRFDAAMTLSKKHYQRLWYPNPGSGGDIPTRAEYGLTKAQFNRAMPIEFWREVVERVAQEVPDTLLLAEAFWLMEGYFVRTLGMHRVYNSAFMNMLKKEDNAQYRSAIKNILEFNPEILKRFVNFMNNPDEETAIAQFGKGDKYFGICAMLVTMPGLPMFGHGQIEGFTEKYGMEYNKSYWDEQTDWDLVHRHEQDIFPLMRKRNLFAEVYNFYLYDFYAGEGHVNENVFAYSNSFYDEHCLMIYNNKFENTAGWVKTSAAYTIKQEGSDQRVLVQKTLGEAFKLHNDDRFYVVFREHISGLEFIRNCKEIHENGLFLTLNAYQYQIFLDVREVEDNVWNHYSQLAAYLDGRGVPSIDEALKETFLKPIHNAFRGIVNADTFNKLVLSKIIKVDSKVDTALVNRLEQNLNHLIHEIKKYTSGAGVPEGIVQDIMRKLEIILHLPVIDQSVKCPNQRKYKLVIKLLKTVLNRDKSPWFVLFAWLFVHRLGAVVDSKSVPEESRSGFDDWLLHKILEDTFWSLGVNNESTQMYITLIKILTSHQNWWNIQDKENQMNYQIMHALLQDSEVRYFIGVNRYRDVLWYSKEAFDELMNWLFLVGFVEAVSPDEVDEKIACKKIMERFDIIKEFKKAEEQSEYRIEKLLETLKI